MCDKMIILPDTYLSRRLCRIIQEIDILDNAGTVY